MRMSCLILNAFGEFCFNYVMNLIKLRVLIEN